MATSPTAEASLAGLPAEEAFALLGSETRLAIIQALWDAGAHHTFDDIDNEVVTISFSALQRAVAVRDNGHFNYHLSKLVPHLVTQTPDGYHLSGAGKMVARSIAAIAGEALLSGKTDLETTCPVCDGQLTTDYEDQWLRVTCTTCPGSFGASAPEGTIYNAPFPAAGIEDRTPDEALTVGLKRCMLDAAYLIRGICRECASEVSATVSVCDDHQPVDDHCDHCGTPFEAWGDVRCGSCRYAKRLPVEVFVMGLTPVISFCHEDGIDLLGPTLEDFETIDPQFQTAVTRDPLRILVTVASSDDTLTVELDETLEVIGIE